MNFDGKAFGEQIVEQVRGYVDRTMGPIAARLDAFEKRLNELPIPQNGKDADPDTTANVVFLRLAPQIEAMKAEIAAVPKVVEETIAAIPLPKDGADGKDADLEATAGLVFMRLLPEVETIRKDVAALKPDLDRFESSIKESVGTLIAEKVAEIPLPKDGKDADPEAVIAAVTERVVPQIEEKLRQESAARIESGLKAFETAAFNESLILIPQRIKEAVDALPPAKDGTSVMIEDVAPLIQEEVAKAVAALPPAKDGEDGKSVTAEDLAPLVERMVSEAVAAIEKPRDGVDGKSVTFDDVWPDLKSELHAELSTWAKPQDGKSVTVEDVKPLIESEVEKRVAAIPVPKDGKDGVGLAGALIDREGGLVVTLTDGTVKSLGLVVGKDGETPEAPEMPDIPDIETIHDDDLNERIAKAVRLMAETPVSTIASAAVEDRRVQQPQAPVTVVLPKMELPAVNVMMPEPKEQQISVTVEQPPKRKTRTVVEEHDARGRVKAFRQEEVD